MKKIKLYRADEYYKNSGDLIGFFTSKEDAEAEIEYSTLTTKGEGTFSQITVFEVDESKLEGIEIEDTERILDEDIWGASEVVEELYYSE